MGFSFNDLLSFDKMLTPIIVKIIYWLGLVAAILAGLSMLFMALRMNSLGSAFVALLALVLGPIAVRVYCELLIVAFNIYGVLCEIRDNGRRG